MLASRLSADATAQDGLHALLQEFGLLQELGARFGVTAHEPLEELSKE